MSRGGALVLVLLCGGDDGGGDSKNRLGKGSAQNVTRFLGGALSREGAGVLRFWVLGEMSKLGSDCVMALVFLRRGRDDEARPS